MSKYDDDIEMASEMIAEFGQSVIWRKSNNQPDPTKPWKTVDAGPQDFQVTMFFKRPGSGLERALFHLIKGSDAPTGAPNALMAPVPFTPEVTDQVIRDGNVLVIKDIDVLAPDGTPILWFLEFA